MPDLNWPRMRSRTPSPRAPQRPPRSADTGGPRRAQESPSAPAFGGRWLPTPLPLSKLPATPAPPAPALLPTTPGSAAGLAALRPDLLEIIFSFLPVVWLAQTTALSTSLRRVACNHSHWRLFVLQGFGAYYDDYVTSLRDNADWRRLLIYIRRVHHNVDKGIRKVRVFPNALRPTVRFARARRNGRRYRGSMELTDNCSAAIWENGRHVQILRVRDGAILVDIDTGVVCPRYFHRIASSHQKLFVCVHTCIKVWDLTAPEKEPVTLPPPKLPGLEGRASTWEDLQARRGRPLELLVHKKRLVLFESNGLYLWHTDTLEPLAAVAHVDPAMPENPHHLEVQWMGQWFATWQRGISACLNIWSLDGELDTVLSSEHVVVQLDVVRVTWQDVRELGHFLLAGLDEASLIRIWDSASFTLFCSFNAGCVKPFDLIITQDFLATVNDNVQANRLEIEFWKLWLANDKAMEEAEASAPDSPRSRPCFEMMKRLSLVDVDTYFASYRNFFNVCSYHKNGCESVQVFRSKSLSKKIHFQPAKHTKFEEWIAIQVDLDGTVKVYDFRPDGVSFDDIPQGVSPASEALGELVAARDLPAKPLPQPWCAPTEAKPKQALRVPRVDARGPAGPRERAEEPGGAEAGAGPDMERWADLRQRRDEVEELQRQRDWLAEQLQAAQEELGRLRAVVAAAETEADPKPGGTCSA